MKKRNAENTPAPTATSDGDTPLPGLELDEERTPVPTVDKAYGGMLDRGERAQAVQFMEQAPFVLQEPPQGPVSAKVTRLEALRIAHSAANEADDIDAILAAAKKIEDFLNG